MRVRVCVQENGARLAVSAAVSGRLAECPLDSARAVGTVDSARPSLVHARRHRQAGRGAGHLDMSSSRRVQDGRMCVHTCVRAKAPATAAESIQSAGRTAD